MKIGIVTVLFKSDTVIDAFVKCFNEQTFQNFHIYIIENDVNNYNCEKIVSNSAHFEYTFVRNKANVGVATANNQGLDFFLSKTDYTHILFLNNDIEVNHDFLQKQVEILNSNTAVDALVPKMFYYGTENKIWYAGGSLSYLKGGGRHYGHNKPDRLNKKELYQVTYSPTCSLIIKTELLKKSRIRMWDELFVYEDDYIFCMELYKAGIKLYYTPTIHLQHKISTSTGGTNTEFSRYYLTRNWFYVGLVNNNIFTVPIALLKAIAWLIKGRHIELKAIKDGWTMALKKKPT